QISQRPFHTLLAVQRTQIVALVRDAQGAQPEASRCNRRHPAQRAPIRWRTVPHQSRLRTGFIEEEIAVPALHIVQKVLGCLRHLGQRAVDEHARLMAVLLRRLLLGLGRRVAGRDRLLVLQRVRDGRGSSQCDYAGCARFAQQLASGYAWSGQTERATPFKSRIDGLPLQPVGPWWNLTAPLLHPYSCIQNLPACPSPIPRLNP